MCKIVVYDDTRENKSAYIENDRDTKHTDISIGNTRYRTCRSRSCNSGKNLKKLEEESKKKRRKRNRSFV